MKKVLFVLSLVAVMVSCSKSPVDEAVEVFDNGAKAYAEAAKAGTYTAVIDATIEQAKAAQAFLDANKDFNPQGDDLKRLQEAETNCMKAMEEAQKAVEKNYEGKEDEAMGEALAAFGKLAELEKSCPDIEKFTFIKK